MFIHASIRTSNLERSVEFYTELLGLKIVNRLTIPQSGAELVFLQDPQGKGATLELTFFPNQKKFLQADYEDRLFDHLAFSVESMEQTLEAMRKHNVTVTDEPYRLGATGSLIAFVEDPDGTLLELIEKTDPPSKR